MNKLIIEIITDLPKTDSDIGASYIVTKTVMPCNKVKIACPISGNSVLYINDVIISQDTKEKIEKLYNKISKNMNKDMKIVIKNGEFKRSNSNE